MIKMLKHLTISNIIMAYLDLKMVVTVSKFYYAWKIQL